MKAVRWKPLDIVNEKGVIRVEEEKFRIPVDVRGTKTSVWLSSVSPRMNTIELRDQFKPMAGFHMTSQKSKLQNSVLILPIYYFNDV